MIGVSYRILLLFVILSFFNSKLSIASDTLVLNHQSTDFFVTGNQIDYLIDSSNSLTIDQVIHTRKFIYQHDPAFISIQKPNQSYWLRIHLKNKGSKNQRWLLENLDLHINEFEVYIVKNEQTIIHQKAGYGIPFKARTYVHKNFVFDLPIQEGETQDLYIKAKSVSPNVFLLKIQTHQHFSYYSLNEYYLLGIFYGVLAIMALYNLLLFIYFRERVYLYYFIYILSCALLTLGDDGLGFEYLWPSNPGMNRIINSIAPPLFLVSFFIYSNSFLKLKDNLASYYKYILVSFLLYLTFYLMDIFYLHFNVGYRTFTFPFICIYILSIICWRKGYKPARFYIAGYSFILLHFLYLFLKTNGLFTLSNLILSYSFNFGIILEILIFSIALNDRLKLLKKEREDALLEKEKAQRQMIYQLKENEKLKDKVNQELETKVLERTKALNQKSEELSEANRKLEELNEKLRTFASELDIKNWELQKKVKEETKARISAEEVSYEEFSKIFPNEHHCMKYLGDLKWDKGFVCKKCGNSKFSEADNHFTRKCTTCKYAESVTASTLFHGIKFPLNKAFYIVYTTSYSTKKYTIDQLAEILELRRNTCWSFRKKIQERKELLETKLKVKEIDNWQSLFLD